MLLTVFNIISHITGLCYWYTGVFNNCSILNTLICNITIYNSRIVGTIRTLSRQLLPYHQHYMTVVMLTCLDLTNGNYLRSLW